MWGDVPCRPWLAQRRYTILTCTSCVCSCTLHVQVFSCWDAGCANARAQDPYTTCKASCIRQRCNNNTNLRYSSASVKCQLVRGATAPRRAPVDRRKPYCSVRRAQLEPASSPATRQPLLPPPGPNTLTWCRSMASATCTSPPRAARCSAVLPAAAGDMPYGRQQAGSSPRPGRGNTWRHDVGAHTGVSLWGVVPVGQFFTPPRKYNRVLKEVWQQPVCVTVGTGNVVHLCGASLQRPPLRCAAHARTCAVGSAPCRSSSSTSATCPRSDA